MKPLFRPAITILALLLPGAAFADVTGNNVTVSNGQTVNLETAAVGSGGGDILFTGTGISFQGTAKGANLTMLSGGSLSGSSQFNSLTSVGASGISAFASLLSSAAITPVTAGIIVGYKTNAGNSGALLLNTVGSASISIQFVTFESGTSGGPTITAVLNNYGLIPTGFANSGIAQGSLFIIKGSGLASATSVSALQSSASPGLPKTLNGASVSVTVGNTTVTPVFYYAINVQLALVLPSNTPTGNGTVTVTFNGQTSSAFSITVVSSAFGFLSNDSTGTGGIRAVNPNDGSYFGVTNSAQPGTLIELYGSGLGADPTRDTTFSQSSANFPFTVTGLSAVYVGGIQATIQYQGASGYPGLNQVNVILPKNLPTGCYISVVGVLTSGAPTNTLTLPVGTGTCSDPGIGVNSSTVTSLNGLTNIREGLIEMVYSQTGTKTPVIEGFASFQQYAASSFGSGTSLVSIGGCLVTEAVTGTGSFSAPTPLNAGTITVSSPNAGFSPVQLSSFGALDPGIYSTISTSTGASLLPTGFLTQSGGIFPFTATAGTTAPAVGAFNTQVTFPTPLLAWANETSLATVTRSAGVTVTWTGGQAGTYVIINGNSSSSSGFGSFTCLSTVAAGTFTVPSYILAALPASTNGSLGVANETIPVSFAATGLDLGETIGFVSYSNTVAYQ